jgi:predicted dehydrogenase
MSKVRIGITGLGNIGNVHANNLLENKVPRAEFSAICSSSEEKRNSFAEKGLKTYSTTDELIQSGEIDALLIATPHYQHPDIGIKALEAGLHIMVEKPIAAHKADAERLIAAAEKYADLTFSAVFQLRTEPRYIKIRDLIQSGELGDIVRVIWVMTDWFRSEAYYQSGGWRATWKGEGGGVLLNQCLHQLDALQWIMGMPSQVRSHVGIGRFHDIEVEDDVTCYLEYPNGATGMFLSSTGEIPGSNRFEIAGTKGRLLLEPHAQLLTNFVDNILDGTPLIAPGASGIGSVELANVMLYSGLLDKPIDLPMDSAAWEEKLNDLIANSTHEKKVVEVSTEDFSASFRR